MEKSGFFQHRKSAIEEPSVNSGKSDWLRIRNEYSAHAQKVGSGQSSRSLTQTRRIMISGAGAGLWALGSNRTETRAHIGQNRKNWQPQRIRKPKTACFYYENRKPDAKKRKTRKLQWTSKPKNRSLLAQKQIEKIPKTAKPENPNAPLNKELYTE